MVVQGGRRDSWRVFLPLAVPFAILVAVAVFGELSPPRVSTMTPAPGSRGSLVWGDGIFANSVEMKAWLKLHGGSYDAWAKRHPAALRLVRPKRAVHGGAATHRPEKARPSVRPKAVVRHTSSISSPAFRSNGVTRSGASNLFIWLAIAVGLLLGVGATAPRALFRGIGVASVEGERDLRFCSAAAGLAVLVGTVVGTQIG